MLTPYLCVQTVAPCDSPCAGASYTFIGLLTLEFTAAQSEGKVASAFIEAAGYIMIGVGVLYFLLGIFCVKRVSHLCTVLHCIVTQRASCSHTGVMQGAYRV
jgi:hypothetical protein